MALKPNKTVCGIPVRIAGSIFHKDAGGSLTVNEREAVGAYRRAAISKPGAKRLAEALGLSETETALLALARMRDSILPAYPADDGPLTEKQLAEATKVPVDANGKTPGQLMRAEFKKIEHTDFDQDEVAEKPHPRLPVLKPFSKRFDKGTDLVNP